MLQTIVDAVDKAVESLSKSFLKEPTRYFTENDLVCTFHRLVHDGLVELKLESVADRDEKPHSLIHCEYPTPFRCDMGEKRFEIKTDEDRTPGGQKYKRGRFDVVVLNPSFLKRHSFSDIKGQNYAQVCSSVRPGLVADDPMILYGIEFVYRRDEIKLSKGNEWEKAANQFVAEVQQDANKLTASLSVSGVMKKATLLALLKGTTGKVKEYIQERLGTSPSVKLVFVE